MGLVAIVEVMVIYPVWQTLIKHTGAMHSAKCSGSKEELDVAFAPEGAPGTRQVALEVEIV